MFISTVSNRDSFLAACEIQRIPVSKPTSATKFQAMLRAGGISGTGTRRSVNMLAEGHCEVYSGSIKFTYDGKEKAEFIEWTEKNINNEITVYIQRHLNSKSITPSEVKCVQVVVGGDHGDTAFQFGVSVSVDLIGDRIIDFEVTVCELICREDTAN